MQTATLAPNPFALMLDPAAIFAAMDQSGRLGALKRQIFRPLDKPVIARADVSLAAFDEEIDDDFESDE
jgi:hypothetical protein